MDYTVDDLSKMDFSDLIELGEKIREDNIGGRNQNKAFEEAHKVFEMALVNAEMSNNLKQLATVYGQIGLTYRHEGKYVGAEKYYKKIMKVDNSTGAAATNLRHLADLDYLRGHYEDGLSKAITAYKLAETLSRSDQVWFSHAVVKILVAMLGKWLKHEREDLEVGLDSSSASKAQKKAWETGYYGDVGKIFLLEPLSLFKGLWGVILTIVYYGVSKLNRRR